MQLVLMQRGLCGRVGNMNASDPSDPSDDVSELLLQSVKGAGGVESGADRAGPRGRDRERARGSRIGRHCTTKREGGGAL